VERNLEKMKTFIVYDLDSKMPIAVGEQVSAETARYCASVATGIFEANLLAEEIDLEKQITYWTTNVGDFCEGIPGNENEVCSSVCTHFACVCIASIRSFTTAFSGQTRAAI
jgi:hypothetical protein